LAISGQIDRGVLYFDDGAENNLFNVDNGNSTTRIRFIGTAKPDDDLTISTNLEFDLRSNASDRIDQTQENTGVDGDTLFRIRRASVSVGSVTFGKLTIGQDKTATDDIAEIDLSGTYYAAEPSVTDLGGNLFFRNDAHVNGRRMNQIFSNFDGNRDDEIRYDSPSFGGFSAAGDFAQGGMYEIALRFDSTKE
jgi:predicted porin